MPPEAKRGFSGRRDIDQLFDVSMRLALAQASPFSTERKCLETFAGSWQRHDRPLSVRATVKAQNPIH
jgi:hypothetical protein